VSLVSLREKNLPLLAERLNWPAGALEAVQAVEAEFPRYLAWWSPGGWCGDPGFYAIRPGDRARTLYAANPGKLTVLIADEIGRLPRYLL
jgi:hypothetical protein